MSRGSASRAFLDVLVFVAIVGVSVALLWDYQWQMLAAPWQPSFVDVLPYTAWTALRVWAFFGLATGVLAAILLRRAPDLGLLDAILGGALAVWVLSYVGGNLIGPLGLMRSWVVWSLLALGLLAVGVYPPKLPAVKLAPGQRLTVLALAMATPGILLLQLGSPVPPHFDVFAPAAAAQRIVTFAHYLPFDNDPYGYYDAASQCPAVELFYALLALGSGTRLAITAETATLLPLVWLLILGTYRLGKTLADDVTGGLASLLVFATVLMRALPTGHGRYVSFVPVVVGLAFFLDRRREPLRMALGALILGTAVSAHAIIGTFGMMTAAGTVGFWILCGDVVGGLAGVGLLAGASLVALPSVAVGLRFEVPYPALPLVQLLGIALIVFSASRMPARPLREVRWLVGLMTAVVMALLAKYPSAIPTIHDHILGWRYPLLWAAGGLGIVFVMLSRTPVLRAPIFFAFMGTIAAEWVGARWQGAVGDPRLSIALHDLIFKADFWYPFALVFPAACLFAAIASWVPRRLVVYGLLLLLFLPLQYGNKHPGGRDPNYYQHAIVEGWGEQLGLAKGGYWGSTGDRRWAQSPAEFALMDLLRAEIAAGRITLATHIVHLTPYIYLYKDTVLFSVFTGINADTYVAEYVFDRSNAGGRFYPAPKVHAALAGRPPYVLVHDVTLNAVKLADSFPDPLALDGYEEIFNRDGIRLFRASAS